MPRVSRLTADLAAVYFCFGAVLFTFGPCLTAMADTFRVPVAHVGLLWTFYAVGLTPAVLIAGYLSQRTGRKRLLVGALALVAVACTVLALASRLGGFWTAMAALVLLGAGGGALQTVVLAAVADANRPAPAFALNFLFTVLAVGAVCGPATAAALLRAEWAWEWVFAGLAGLFGVLLVRLRRRALPEGAEAPLTLTRARQLLRTPMLWLLIAVMALYAGAEGGLLTWICVFGEETLGLSRATAGLAVSAFWVLMIVGRAATTAAVLRFRPEALLALLAGGGTMAALLLTRVHSAAGVLVGAAAAGLFFSGISGLIGTDASRQFSQERGPIFGLTLSGIGVGSLFAPAAMGMIAGAAGLRAALLLPPALLGLVMLIYLARLRQPEAGQGGDRTESKHFP